MIYHEMFGKHLRLGNFLFKYAWSVAIGRKIGNDSVYPNDYYLWQYLENPPFTKLNWNDTIPDSKFLKVNWEWSLEEEKRVTSIVDDNRQVVVSLDSFFQSEQWFRDYKDEVWKSLQFKLEEKERVKEKYSYLFNSKGYCPLIGLSIRLGDFQGHGDFYQIKPQWYIDVLNEHFPYWEERKVVVFSDHIEQAKKIFSGYNFYYAEPNGTHTHDNNFKHYHGDASEHLILGSMMDDFIIGNSTFSWWQAWLATYNQPLSKVVHSGKVFSDTGRMKDIDTTHYYPKRWIKHEI